MADPQSNARLRADAGAPTSGVIHVRTRLTAGFTVISNALAQRRGSAVTVGVAAYISSLPDGSSVTIPALCEHFSEGEILISRALRELEAAGYLERRRERTSTGHVRTRTYFYDVPGGGPDPDTDPDSDTDTDPDSDTDPDGPPEPPKPRRPRKQGGAAAAVTRASAPAENTVAAPAPAETEAPVPLAPPAPAEAETPVPLASPAPAHAPAEAETPVPLADADPRAVAVLTALRLVDPRLILSAQETARLAPAVARWLAAGLLPTHITDHLTARLPDHFLTRPVGILAYRLKETPLPVPARSAELPARPMVLPMQNCDGCDRGFRSAGPGRCRGCRAEDELRAAG